VLVIDASIALAWCFRDEQSGDVMALLDRVHDETAMVPPLWRVEVANALLMAERRRRVEQAEVERLIELLSELPIVVDDVSSGHDWSDTLLLARNDRLTLYDATYLELAMREGLPLATLDTDLAVAARRHGVHTIP
jgi:predicted nucleic acid-binding protein